jgi:WD40 repeat protein
LHVEEITEETWQQRNPKGTPQEWETYKAQGRHTAYKNMHPEISKINWVYFREEKDNFEASFAGLLELCERQQEYVQQHTYFLAKALAWERQEKQSRYLLIGDERKQAEAWLNIRFKNEQPPCLPTDLHSEFVTESIKNGNNLMTQVFLAHAEEDSQVMDRIRKSLWRECFTVWTNKTDIQTGEAFEDAIERGIEQADNVVYLLSPDSLNSQYCQQELKYALSLNKRIIPLLVRETPPERMPPLLRGLQYIDLTDNVREEDYQLDESQLLKILRQDAGYYNEHKVLLTKALKWERQHRNPSILLRGYNLDHAQAWLKVANSRKQHPPTALQEEFIAESLRQPPASSLDVFISYSRADSDFARKLNDTLQIQGKTTWFDQESIASGSDFQQEIYRGIKACDNVLFILSPRSVNSPYCKGEVEYAASLNKRFVTVLHRQVNSADLHPELAKVQWIDFNQNQRDFNANFNQLVRTLDTDREHVHSHSKWSQRAIEWQEKDKSADLLLRGSEFAVAQNWLQTSLAQNKQPVPTALQQTFVEESHKALIAAEETEKQRQAELLRLQEEKTKEAEARLAEQKKSARRQKHFLFAVSAALVVSGLLGVTAFFQYLSAATSELEALSASSESLLASHKDLEGLIAAIRAGKRLKKLGGVTQKDSEERVLRALQQVLPRIREYNRLEEVDNFRDSTLFDYSGNRDLLPTVKFDPKGELIASANGKTVKLWKPDGTFLQTLDENSSPVIDFSPDGEMIATASGKTVKLWSRHGNLLQTLNGHSGLVNALAFSPDGEMIVTAGADQTVKLWKRDGTFVKTLGENLGVQMTVAFSPDGQLIVAGGWIGKLRFWNRDGTPLDRVLGHGSSVNAVVFSPDSKTIVTGTSDGKLTFWNREEETPKRSVEAHNDAVWGVSFSPDGKTIASVSGDRKVKLWSQDGTLLITLEGHNDVVSGISFNADGRMIASASTDGTVKLWKTGGTSLKILEGHGSSVHAVKFSPDSKLIATGGEDRTVKLWSRDATLRNILKEQSYGPIYAVDWSPDGQLIATASGDNTVKLWKRDGILYKILKHEAMVVGGVSFSPDGKMIASASADKTVKLWSRDGTPGKTLKGHQDMVYAVAFSPDGKMIASASADKTVKLWSRDGTLGKTLKGHQDTVYAVAFSPDGKMIASASADGKVILWSRDGTLLTTLAGHQGTVYAVTFSPDGKMIASASADGKVILWSRDGTLLRTLAGHSSAVYAVDFSPDGKLIASASNDKTVMLWEVNQQLNLDELLNKGCDWVRDYLKNNANVEKSDRNLCDGIGIQK